jgi:hypothetical protein
VRNLILVLVTIASLTFAGVTYMFPPSAVKLIPAVRVAYRTHTVVRWKTRTDTVTGTVSTPDTGAVDCIRDLYGELENDAASGHILPRGWWDARCTPYVPG